MMPHVPHTTISEVAYRTGKSWNEVAKEKLKTDLIFYGPFLIILLVLLAVTR